jgi:hypothetical protein
VGTLRHSEQLCSSERRYPGLNERGNEIARVYVCECVCVDV